MTQISESPVVLQDDVALAELNAQLDDLTSIVVQINKLRADNLFRFLSKQARNQLLTGLMEKSGAVEDSARAAYRALKKTKRERLPEEVADLLLAGRRELAIACNPSVTGQPTTNEADE